MSEDRAEYELEIETEEPDEEQQIDVDALPEATYEDILAEYEQEEGEFVYPVGEGKKAKKYRGMRITCLSEKIALSEKADEFREQYERVRKTPLKDVAEPMRAWKQYATKPMSKKSATLILYITKLLVSPKLSQLQCIRLHRKGGNALMEIGGPLLTGSVEEAYKNEMEAVEEAKND